MLHEFDFRERLGWSEGQAHRTTPDTINAMMGGNCESVVAVTELTAQRAGVDYVATLRSGATVFVDHKAREQGCSKFWKHGPELALETWSVVPGSSTTGDGAHVGWTLDESKATDYILFTFDPGDSDRAYLIPFQLLRVAFRSNHAEWTRAYFSPKQQSWDGGRGWQSQCTFVPVSIVRDAVNAAMETTTKNTTLEAAA